MQEKELLKIKERIQKMIALSESEAKLGNEGAAANMAQWVQDQIEKYNLELSELQLQHPEIKYEPLIGVSTIENPFLSKRPREFRKPFVEFLAQQIAFGQYCDVKIHSINGKISFYGVDFNRDIAILMFNKLTEMTLENCKIEMEKAKKLVGKTGMDVRTKKIVAYPKVWMSDEIFTNSFFFGFGTKLRESYLAHQTDEKGNNLNQALFDRISEFIKVTEDRYYSISVDFKSERMSSSAIEIGKRYGNFTAKGKAEGLQKSANIAISASIQNSQNALDIQGAIGEAIVLIDGSGSMCYGEKMSGAKSGAIEFAKDAASKKFAVGLIGFDDQIEVIEPTIEINERWEMQANELYARGGTSLMLAIKTACERWKSYSRFKKVILIATDGEPTDATKSEILAYADMLKASGIEFMTVGTHDADSDFLEKLSSGNKTLRIDNSGFKGALKGMAGLLPA